MLVADLHHGDGGTQRVGGDGNRDAVGVELARHEGIVLAVAALPVAAVDVDDERRILVRGAEQVVALALALAVGLVHARPSPASR